MRAIVSDVRVTFEGCTGTASSDRETHPIAGAVIGAVLAGAGGAVVGAALGSGADSETTRGGRLIACGFTATTFGGETNVFLVTTPQIAVRTCSLLRNGDTVVVWRKLKSYPQWHWDSYWETATGSVAATVSTVNLPSGRDGG